MEYVNFRNEAAHARRIRALALAAAAAIVIVVAGWVGLSRFAAHSQGVGLIAWAEGWRPASIDLRGHEALRGGEPGPTLPPIVLPRGKVLLTIDLPVGSEPGKYEVQLVQGNGHPITRAAGSAILVNGLTVLSIRIDARRAQAGHASLLVRRSGQSRSRYIMQLK